MSRLICDQFSIRPGQEPALIIGEFRLDLAIEAVKRADLYSLNGIRDFEREKPCPEEGSPDNLQVRWEDNFCVLSEVTETEQSFGECCHVRWEDATTETAAISEGHASDQCDGIWDDELLEAPAHGNSLIADGRDGVGDDEVLDFFMDKEAVRAENGNRFVIDHGRDIYRSKIFRQIAY